jgi:hydroxypyruvate isomerase
MEGDLARTLERHLQIGHIQLADNPGRHEPGTGEINFPSCSAISRARLHRLDRR